MGTLEKLGSFDEIKKDSAQKYDFVSKVKPSYQVSSGLSRSIVEEISAEKKEPEWMRSIRLKAFDIFMSKPVPTWGPDLSVLDFDNLVYYIKPDERKATDWNEVPKEIKETFDKLGVPEMEKKYLAGSVAQLQSESVYSRLRKQWADKGVIFTDMDSAVQQYPDIVKEHFGRIVPASDNKFAALNTAVWSGGSFLYVPSGVNLDLPVQAYFRMNGALEGQFERTLIIAEPGSSVHYIEGCTAPTYSQYSLHAAIVEVYVKRGGKVRYTSVQNWSDNIINGPTKRAWIEEDGRMEWVQGSLGSKITMTYPSSILRGERASTSNMNVALGIGPVWKDNGAKVIHAAPNTSSKIVAKSISGKGGMTVYRGLLRINPNAYNSKASVQCDALILDDISKSNTYPHNEILNESSSFSHEASVGKISDEQVYYLMSRGIREEDSRSLIVLGFLDDVLKEIPLEYSIEFNKLIRLEMSKYGAVG
ncbi:MAG: Fe-S cluster assembly protein SufB [Candidatus Marsarchaeota archaeon]|nr:Fe-S cluster assembly protein SufB [Candidatus Marsarchaeota archaeon]MCL5418898.1 Fe-S cluster assembly protein SufB [Candidatus Marsarchaeota archaeon]